MKLVYPQWLLKTQLSPSCKLNLCKSGRVVYPRHRWLLKTQLSTQLQVESVSGRVVSPHWLLKSQLSTQLQVEFVQVRKGGLPTLVAEGQLSTQLQVESVQVRKVPPLVRYFYGNLSASRRG